ncbi:Metallophosphoesterase domain-containing protein 1 [Durusdinium trenchii]
MFRSTVPVADFMDQPPWIFRARDLPELRARVTQGVFSNLHRFFVSAYTKDGVGGLAYPTSPASAPPEGDPPVALLRWRSRSSPSWRRWILRFHSNRSVQPSPAFFEKSPQERLQAELPFAEMQIAWIDPKDQNVTAEASVAYETFTWSTAMGVVWRCAHPYQLHSLHDRSAAHINILFNNLFWQTGAGADGTYRWLFRRPAFEVDPEERDVMGGAVTLDHLRSYHITAKLGEHLFQSFPLSRYHVELLRRHDLASTESVRELLSALGHSTPCLDHPHGFKVMKHWNSLKTKRHFADHNQIGQDRMMPNSRHTQWQMCLYDFFINTSQGEAGSMDVPGLELCDEMLAAHCSGATFLDLRKECWEKTWECLSPWMLCEESLWRLILLLNQHIDNNPFLSSSCRLLYRPGLDLSQDQSYLSSGERMEIENQRRPACQAAEQSILAREHLDGSSLGLSFNYYQVLASTCEIFDLGHLLQCHLEQLQVLQSDLLSSAWSHLRP